MMKESEVKKIIKNFNKYGKGLRKDGVYLLDSNMLYSAIIDPIHGTPGVFNIEFIRDSINKAFNMLSNNKLIDGTSFNKILSGTGLIITLENDKIIRVENKTDIWFNENNSEIEKKIMTQYSKYNSLIKDVEYEIEIPSSLIDDMVSRKTFIINLCEFMDLPGIDILKVSNKSLKNFSKVTTSIKVEVSYRNGDIRIVRFTVSDDIANTQSIYAILVDANSF